MEILRDAQATTAWIRFHGAPVFMGLSLVVVCVIAAVYFLSPPRQSSRTISDGIKTTSPAVLGPVSNDSTVTATEVQPAETSQPPPAVNTRLHVNGQPVAVPQTGTIHKVIKDNNGVTTVNVSVDANSSGSSSSDSSTNIQLDSTTEQSSYIESSK
ncbi:MAG: hypothetical protein ABI716_00410 [Candidatus Saccharibacteria bacterium]